MSAIPNDLPAVQRVVTFHNESGLGVVQQHDTLSFKDLSGMPGARTAPIWVMQSLPSNDTNNAEDGAQRSIDPSANLGIVAGPAGVNFQSTDLAPGAETSLHRTTSVDYNILIEGEVLLINEDGSQTHLKTPGDVVIMKGTLHAWKNPGNKWARWHTVVLAAQPPLVNGKVLTSHVE